MDILGFFRRAEDFLTPDPVRCNTIPLLSEELPEPPLNKEHFMVSVSSIGQEFKFGLVVVCSVLYLKIFSRRWSA